jgi:hypothetical protein
MLGLFKKKEPPKPQAPSKDLSPVHSPPVPEWQPAIRQPLNRIADRVRYYTNGSTDFVVFRYGTCVLLDDDMSDQQAEMFAKQVLSSIFHAHPDMKPGNMDDGNILVRYNLPAINVVLSDIVQQNWQEIDLRHQQALVAEEVLITPLGPNKFDDFGKKALFGRCFMFMDAQRPQVLRIERKGI